MARANIPQELRALPLEHIIGAPLSAAIRAQAQAAQTTVDFIKEVGLTERKLEDNEVGENAPLPAIVDETAGEGKGLEAVYVEFKFDRVIEEEATEQLIDADGEPRVDAANQPVMGTVKRATVVPSRLTVPLLAIVPIPYIRISDMTIDFEFQIKEVESAEDIKEKKGELKTRVGFGWFGATAKGSYSNKNINKRETDRRTTLKINVNAVQDQLPEGLGRVLDILQEAMKVVPIKPSTTLPVPT